MSNNFGAQGVYPSPRGQASIAWTLQPGATRNIPSGTWMVGLDLYACLQEYDPVQGQWLLPGGGSTAPQYVNSDGFNYRIANLSGCVVGAVVSTAGSAYVAGTVTAAFSVGAAAATVIVGGAVSTTNSVTNAGTGYTYPPLVFLDSPPLGAGLQATGYSTLSGSTLSTVTIDNQGAGYTNVPNVYIINDPRDTTGTQGACTVSLTGAGTVTQLLITNQGTPQTTLQPTIAFTSSVGTSAAAFPIMVRSIGAYVLTTPGSGYSGAVIVTAIGNGQTVANVLTNPKWTTNLVRTREARILYSVTSTATANSGLSATGQTLIDGGIYAGSAPTAIIYGGGPVGTATASAGVTFTWANNASTVTLQPV